ncbi:MAG: sulfatase, partial [Candidatus Eisenbacteria sp.]|nr:sulfatase [Candidatus Eisenbacteria bacterium]
GAALTVAIVLGRRWRTSLRCGPTCQRVGTLGILLAALLGGLNLVAYGRVACRPSHGAVRENLEELERPDVLIVLFDALRRDHVSSFGYDRPTTPNIDRLFEESWVFTQAYVPSTYTSPSVVSLFTGLYPSSHRFVEVLSVIPDAAPTLAEHFRSYGYATAAFVANGTITPSGGFDQGFEYYFPAGAPAWCRHQRTAFEQIIIRLLRPNDAACAQRISREAARWMRANADRPRLAYIHYLEPHHPYTPAPEDREAVAPGAPPGPASPYHFADFKHLVDCAGCADWECLAHPPTYPASELEGMIANYDGDIRMGDRYFGQLLRDLAGQGVLDCGHLVFCTDHGEEFGDHHGWAHVNSIYEEMTACPLMYRPPGGLAETRTVDHPVGLLDLIYTLCLRIGFETPPMHQGVEIPELLPQERRGREQPVLSELPDKLFSLRLRDWKLVRRGCPENPTWRLFDLGSDPRESRDLSADFPDTVAYLRAYLEGLVASYEQTSLGHVDRAVDSELLRQLKDLGYIK